MHSTAAVTSGQIDNEMFVGATALNTSELDGSPDICPVAKLASPPLKTSGKNTSFADWAIYGQEVQTQWFFNGLPEQLYVINKLGTYCRCNGLSHGAITQSKTYGQEVALSDMFVGEHALWTVNYFVMYIYLYAY